MHTVSHKIDVRVLSSQKCVVCQSLTLFEGAKIYCPNYEPLNSFSLFIHEFMLENLSYLVRIVEVVSIMGKRWTF